jgi:DNA-binding transcriptional LysR family regulator
LSYVLDLELIKTFLTVLDAKGFKTAALRLNKTPAAVSMQIKKLEKVLGKRILERSNQGIALTSAGELLRERGQRLMTLNFELLGDMRDTELKGPLNFGSPADYTPIILKKLIPTFQRDFAGVSPSIVLEPSRKLRPRVQSGSLDMAIVATEPGCNEGFPLWSEEIAWFGNAVTQEGKPRIGLLSTDCVLRERSLSDLNSLENEYSIILEAATVSSLCVAAEAGYCQTFLPVSMATGLERSAAMIDKGSFILTFSLIAGSSFNSRMVGRIADKFKRALEGPHET